MNYITTMANNRMFIKCTICNDLKMIAKYYPSSGWYFECIGDSAPSVRIAHKGQAVEMLEKLQEDTEMQNQKAFNKFMDDHRHNDFSNSGPNHFIITFED